jgi:hypothetical protein
MIRNILAAAALGAVALGAQAAPVNLVANGALDSSYAGGSYTYNGVPASVAANYCCSVPNTPGTVSGWDGSFVSIASNSGPWYSPNTLPGFNAAAQGGYIAGVQSDGTLTQNLTLAAGDYMLTWTTANRGADQTYSVLFNGEQIDQVSTTSGAGWTTQTVLFSTAGGANLSFVGDTTFNERDATSFIDNVSVTAVPEPASLLMMALATLGLLAWRRRARV